ncbi:VOC family protein [Thalassiella azotivora]
MTARIRGFGYAIVSASDLDAWETFATGLLGFQVSERGDGVLRLRCDNKTYRLEVRRSDEDRASTIGWEVAGAAELEELAQRLEGAGYAVRRWDPQVAYKERLVSGLVSFTDPDGLQVELFYGFRDDKTVFVSPTGARFVTGSGGAGHVFQMVSDEDAYNTLYFDVLGFRFSDYIDFGPLAATFTHCNERHHSMAFAAVPGVTPGVGHIMFEVDDIDTVGRAYHRVVTEKAAPLAMTLGRHSNDQMISFYVRTPSGFQIEYGTGGLLVDDESWLPPRYDVPSFWGHVRVNQQEPDVIDA